MLELTQGSHILTQQGDPVEKSMQLSEKRHDTVRQDTLEWCYIAGYHYRKGLYSAKHCCCIDGKLVGHVADALCDRK